MTDDEWLRAEREGWYEVAAGRTPPENMDDFKGLKERAKEMHESGKSWWREFTIKRTPPGMRRMLPEGDDLMFLVKRVDVRSTGRRTDMYQETTAYCATMKDVLETITEWLAVLIDKEGVE